MYEGKVSSNFAQFVVDFVLFLQKSCPSPWADCAQPCVSWHGNSLWFYCNSLLVAVAKTECKGSCSWPCPWLCMSLLAKRHLVDNVFENVPLIFWQYRLYIATCQSPMLLNTCSYKHHKFPVLELWHEAGQVIWLFLLSIFSFYYFFLKLHLDTYTLIHNVFQKMYSSLSWLNMVPRVRISATYDQII